jgi:hypothetical protein
MMETDKEQVNRQTGSRPGSSIAKWIIILALAVLVATVVNRGISSRIKAASIVKQETQDLAIPAVSAVHPRLGDSKQEPAGVYRRSHLRPHQRISEEVVCRYRHSGEGWAGAG